MKTFVIILALFFLMGPTSVALGTQGQNVLDPAEMFAKELKELADLIKAQSAKAKEDAAKAPPGAQPIVADDFRANLATLLGLIVGYVVPTLLKRWGINSPGMGPTDPLEAKIVKAIKGRRESQENRAVLAAVALPQSQASPASIFDVVRP